MESKIIKVKDLLTNHSLRIPKYQRPYKWNVENINQLIDDLLLFSDKENYRLGTVVLHKEDDYLDIVDGQQRTISLLLIYHALVDKNKEYLDSIDVEFDWQFKSVISKLNIHNNFQAISKRINEFDDQKVKFIFDKCEVVLITLNDLTEAFQFFDSQNARGKDLEPHDLLKAYHLREMSEVDEKEKIQIIKIWEEMSSQELNRLFENYLYRIREWSKGNSARFFTKKDIRVFKGFNLYNKNKYKYQKIQAIANFYVDHYNQEYHRHIDFNLIEYPFQIDQPIINGKRFFEMINRYQDFRKKMKNIDNDILILINSYKSRGRTGDKYVRNLFDCALMYYIDKFGETDLDKAIEKLFIWAYSLRLKHHSVQIASMDNYALGGKKVFSILREATDHKAITHLQLENINNVVASNIEEVTKKFEELKYYVAK